MNKNFTGLSQDYPRTVLALSLRFPGKFAYVFPFFPKRKATCEWIWPPTRSRDNPEAITAIILFSISDM